MLNEEAIEVVEPLLAQAASCLNFGPQVRFVGLHLTSPEQIFARLGRGASELSESLVPKRRAEFVAGRHAAKLALAHFGCSSAVGRGASGAPKWPPGFCGSISHGADLALAAVTPDWMYRGLGIDVERVVSSELADELARYVRRPEEDAVLSRALPALSAGQRLSLIFSAKESLFKAVHPLSGEFFGFAQARVVCASFQSSHAGQIQLALERELSGGFCADQRFISKFALSGDRVETAVLVPGASSHAVSGLSERVSEQGFDGHESWHVTS